MLGQETTHHPRPTLVLTVNTLLRTHTLVVLGWKKTRDYNLELDHKVGPCYINCRYRRYLLNLLYSVGIQ